MGDLWDDDDGQSWDFVADIDKLVEQHNCRDRFQAAPVPANSQVFPSRLSPHVSQPAQPSKPPATHHLYGPLPSAQYAPPANVLQPRPNQGNAQQPWNARPCPNPQQQQQQAQRSWPGVAQPKAVFSPGVFADSPSPPAPARGRDDSWPSQGGGLAPRNLAADTEAAANSQQSRPNQAVSRGPGSGAGSSAGSGFSGARYQDRPPQANQARQDPGMSAVPTARPAARNLALPAAATSVALQAAPLQPKAAVRQANGRGSSFDQGHLEGFSDDSPPPASAGLPSHSQKQLQELRQRLGCQEGTIGEMRGRLEAAEREKAELQRRLSQMASNQAGPSMGAASHTAIDVRKQLEMVQQQLAFKDQELADERRRQSEITARVLSAETRAKQGQQELQRSEAVRAQMQKELEEVNLERRMQLAGQPRRSPRPSQSSGRLKRAAEANSTKPAEPPSISTPAPPSTQDGSGREKRSVGVNPEAARFPEDGPSWEVPCMPEPTNTHLPAWQEVWARAGPEAACLMSDDPPEGATGPQLIGLHGSASSAVHPSLIAVRQEVHRLSWSDAGSSQLLEKLTVFLADGISAFQGLEARGQQGRSQLQGRLPPSRQLLFQSQRQQQGMVSLHHLTAAWHTLAALLQASPQAQSLAAASCCPADNAGEDVSMSLPEASEEGLGGAYSERVAVASKGQVLRNQQRQKDRPPDPDSLATLRAVGDRSREGTPHGHALHGLLALLLTHQHRLSLHLHTQAQGCQPLQHALLLALNALLACPTFPPPAGTTIAAFGLLRQVVAWPECHPGLLRVVGMLLRHQQAAQELVAGRWGAGVAGAGSQDVDMEGATSQDEDDRQLGGGDSLVDVLLLALGVPERSAGQQGGAGDRQMQALAIMAYLLEVKRFEPLQYLLGGGHLLGAGGGTRLEPPLAQRLFLLAEHLEASWEGTQGRGEGVDLGQAREDTLVRLQGVLVLVRGLLAEAHTYRATIDDLKSTPTSIRISLALTSRLGEWQAPAHASVEEDPLGLHPSLPPWATAIGVRVTGRSYYNTSSPGLKPSLAEIAYLANSIKRRILYCMEAPAREIVPAA